MLLFVGNIYYTVYTVDINKYAVQNLKLRNRNTFNHIIHNKSYFN